MEDIKNPDFDFDAVAKKYWIVCIEFTPRGKIIFAKNKYGLKAVSNMIKNRVLIMTVVLCELLMKKN